MKKFSTISLVLLIALAFFGCDDKPKQGPHESTITAFDRTIAVKGDAAISTADFNTAKGKLQEAMTALNSLGPGDQRNKFIYMLDRAGFAILIKTGNAGPNADANKSMTIGVDYLLTNNAEPTIAQAIEEKVWSDAFAGV